MQVAVCRPGPVRELMVRLVRVLEENHASFCMRHGPIVTGSVVAQLSELNHMDAGDVASRHVMLPAARVVVYRSRKATTIRFAFCNYTAAL